MRTRLILRSAIVALFLAMFFSADISCKKDDPTGDCADCGSGNVRWDSGVSRCRDNNTGQFVKNCCCGH